MNKTKSTNGYNGWANYETWNVALWINNSEGLYALKHYAKDYGHFLTLLSNCSEFTLEGDEDVGTVLRHCGIRKLKTRDGVLFTDARLDRDALDELINEGKEPYESVRTTMRGVSEAKKNAADLKETLSDYRETLKRLEKGAI